MVLGQDHGQKRYGLLMTDQTPAVAKPAKTALILGEKLLFIPAQPVMQAPIPQAPVVTEVALNIMAEPLPEPEVSRGRLSAVASSSVNVREGPGRTFAVLNSLAAGEQVLVIDEANPIAGWSRVRLEGDGVEGYIATRLLVE